MAWPQVILPSLRECPDFYTHQQLRSGLQKGEEKKDVCVVACSCAYLGRAKDDGARRRGIN